MAKGSLKAEQSPPNLCRDVKMMMIKLLLDVKIPELFDRGLLFEPKSLLLPDVPMVREIGIIKDGNDGKRPKVWSKRQAVEM